MGEPAKKMGAGAPETTGKMCSKQICLSFSVALFYGGTSVLLSLVRSALGVAARAAPGSTNPRAG